ncbi:GTPase-activating protein GYP5, partial [Aureobasidium melanogenum]
MGRVLSTSDSKTQVDRRVQTEDKRLEIFGQTAIQVLLDFVDSKRMLTLIERSRCRSGCLTSVALRPFSACLLVPQSHFALVSELLGITRITELHAQTSIRRLKLIFRILIINQLFRRSVFLSATPGLSSQHKLRVALSHNLAHAINLAHTLTQTFLQHVTELLALYSTASQLDSVPCGNGQGEHVALAVQTLDAAHGTERKRKAIASRTCTVGLTCKGSRERGARGVSDQRSGFHAHDPNCCAARGPCVSQLGGDLVQRVLRVWQTELVTEECGLGRAVVRGRELDRLFHMMLLLFGAVDVTLATCEGGELSWVHSQGQTMDGPGATCCNLKSACELSLLLYLVSVMFLPKEPRCCCSIAIFVPFYTLFVAEQSFSVLTLAARCLSMCQRCNVKGNCAFLQCTSRSLLQSSMIIYKSLKVNQFSVASGLTRGRIEASKVVGRAMHRNRFEQVAHAAAEEPAERVEPIQPIAVEVIECGVRNKCTVEDHEDIPEESRSKTTSLHIGKHCCEDLVPGQSKDTAGDELEVLVACDGGLGGIADCPVHAEVDQSEADDHVRHLDRDHGSCPGYRS